jgi:3-hydroxyisobutyrate dehydrogenase
MKAFLGMGLLGSNFTRAMIKKGDDMQVWNRTAERATALEQYGAKAFTEVQDAVKGADVIHVTLKDDAAVDEVLAAASSGFEPGAIIVDHTTTSAKGAIERTANWKEKGFTYLHAPVFMGPSNALESTGFMLVSGDQGVIKKLEPHLSDLTGTLLNLGEVEGKAAAMKLTGNLFLISLTAALSDALALSKAHGVSSKELVDLFTAWNPGAGATNRLKKLVEGKFDQPSWELKMARKDAGLMISAAEEHDTDLVLTPAIAAVMDQWIDKGEGSKDWGIIAKDNL